MSEVRQREPRLEVPGLTETARDEECTLRIPGVCNFRTDTTVWCHSPFAEDKGLWMKAHDPNGCFGCFACHNWLDRTRHEERREKFERAKIRTYCRLFDSGKLRVVRGRK